VEVKTPAICEAPAIEVPAPAIEEPVPVETSPVPLACGLGKLFGQPEKAEWSPVEIVNNVIKLPGVEGAIIALLEGFVVAHHLPENMRGDTFAAFLPQIFGRLNQYTGEMKLGEVDDLVVTARGVQCQMFRHGEVFFAVLGNSDAALPVQELRLCAQELSK
jgi:predicted regulator of Ras-like GTPase activity (Roadblock/LC7/MglB family)